MPRSRIGEHGDILQCAKCGKLSVRMYIECDENRIFIKGCNCPVMYEILGEVPEGCLVAVGEEECNENNRHSWKPKT